MQYERSHGDVLWREDGYILIKGLEFGIESYRGEED